ncbi:hypothetical protein OSB04_030945 [Centaurea solstitialis]|uniref:Retrotransposon Copia-like N-terminal domain-containing protein n=1 Tax=Centaurea solstitialis TaxID=347529 RepID=A0AA38SS34_9ASTR|nr:hypothetical protein OSB04_030945 [Centaurea solstitialis]
MAVYGIRASALTLAAGSLQTIVDFLLLTLKQPLPSLTALLAAFTSAEKTSDNSHKFAFTLSPTNYGYWKAMLHPFLLTHNLFGYVDGTIPCPAKLLQPTDQKTDPRENPNTLFSSLKIKGRKGKERRGETLSLQISPLLGG